MSNLQSDYAALAAAAKSAAADEVLENVRQKHLTSAATWENLAVSARGMEVLRKKRLTERTELDDPEKSAPEPARISGAKPA